MKEDGKRGGGLPSKSPALLALTMEVLELAGNVCKPMGKKRIGPKHLKFVMKVHKDLNK